ERRYEQRGHDATRPILAPGEVFMPVPELLQRLEQFRRVALSRVELDPLTQQQPLQNFGSRQPPQLRIDPRSEAPARELAAFLMEFKGRALIAAESAGRREMLLDILRARHVTPTLVDSWAAFAEGSETLAIAVSPLTNGLLLEEPH